MLAARENDCSSPQVGQCLVSSSLMVPDCGAPQLNVLVRISTFPSLRFSLSRSSGGSDPPPVPALDCGVKFLAARPAAMDIYTGRGDEGETDLQDMSRVSKASPRIEAYGTVDELNAFVGSVRPTGHDDVDELLCEVQNSLHVVQADFANPDPDEDDPQLRESHVERLEGSIDVFDAELDPLESFIIPGGSTPGARLHQARAVCRRAERRAVALDGAEAGVNRTAIVYLNRLSDLLFTLARAVNQREGVPEENPTY